jgi:uroporphyrinogen decarboxylase
MTSRERVITALSNGTPDRVPAVLYGEMVGYVPAIKELLKINCGGQTPLDYFRFDITSFSLVPTNKKRENKNYFPEADNLSINEWGIGRKSGNFMHYTEIVHPLKNCNQDQIRSFEFPDLDQDYRYQGVRERIDDIHRQDLACAFVAGSIFETAWQLRGIEELYSDILAEPAIADFLLDSITDIVSESARQLAERDLDVLILGDDIAMQTGLMMSLEMWRQTFKSRLMRVIHAAKEAKPDIIIFYHSDGNVWQAIPDLIDAGVEVLNPVQPECMDPAKVKIEFGDRLSFFGTISVQNTMPYGKPEDVRAEVKLRMDTIGKHGGLLLAPAHVLQPDTPWENIVTFFEAIEEYGYY